MKLRSKYGWPKGDFTVAQALYRECDSDSRDSVERAREIAEKSVGKLGDLVELLIDRGVLHKRDVEGILLGFEVVE